MKYVYAYPILIHICNDLERWNTINFLGSGTIGIIHVYCSVV